MQWNGYRHHPPPPTYPPPDHVTPFLVDLNRAVAKLSHAVGEIKGSMYGMSTALREVQDMHTMLREMQGMQGRMKEQVRRIEAAVHAKPSTLERAKKIVPIIKEVWPFLAFSAAAAAKLLGYDLGWISGQ